MDNARDRDYYHINRVVPWSPHGPLSVGDEVDVGGVSNPFFRFFETQRRTVPVTQQHDRSVQQVPGIEFLSSVRRGATTTQDLPTIAENVAGHFMRYVRELIWEDVRRREFPRLPSRQRCVWLIPTQEGVRYWLQNLDVTPGFQVLRVRVQGRLHVASQTYLLTDSEPMEETIKKARLYWSGVVEEEETTEIIFEGRVRVEEIMSPSFYA